MISIYGEYDVKNVKRYRALMVEFKKKFGRQDGRFFSASGRVEICGNHTDHNNGKVIVAAINCDTVAYASPNGTDEVYIYSDGYPVLRVNIASLGVREREYGKSLAIVRGVLDGFARIGYKIGGFDAVMTSNVFRGAGVSSSASFEVLIACVLNGLFNENRATPLELAQVSQRAENVYFGKPCGLLDQCGIAFGGLTYIDFASNPPTVKQLPSIPSNLDMYLINTEGNHSDLTKQYASISEDMTAVARFLGVEKLGQTDYSTFMDRMPEMKKSLDGLAILRAIHFFEENARIDEMCEALEKGDCGEFNALIDLSGMSSYTLLQNCYVPGEREQIIPLAIAAARICGAESVRVHGGGFAGTILCFVDEKYTRIFAENMSVMFGEKNVLKCLIRSVGACEVTVES